MHIVLALLGSVVTILWIFYRLAEMGIDLGGLNPFLWQRRRKWRKHYDTNPVFKIENPMEVVALMVTAVAKADGDMSADEKQEILSIFGNEFHLSKRDAADLLLSSGYLLGKGHEVRDNLKAVLAPSIAKFTPEQAQSAVEMLQRISKVAGDPSDMQASLVKSASDILSEIGGPKSKW